MHQRVLTDDGSHLWIFVLGRLVPLGLFQTSYLVVRHRSHIDTRLLFRVILPLMATGAVAGLWLATRVPERALQIVYGIFVILFALKALYALRKDPRWEKLMVQYKRMGHGGEDDDPNDPGGTGDGLPGEVGVEQAYVDWIMLKPDSAVGELGLRAGIEDVLAPAPDVVVLATGSSLAVGAWDSKVSMALSFASVLVARPTSSPTMCESSVTSNSRSAMSSPRSSSPMSGARWRTSRLVRRLVSGVRSSWLASMTRRCCWAFDSDSDESISRKLDASRPTSSVPSTSMSESNSFVSATCSAAASTRR